MFVSITRLRVRRWWHLPEFLWRSNQSMKQASKAAGFVGGYTLADKHRTFWTMTGWKDEASMRAYRGSGPHRAAMPRLAKWCDEAAVAHWQTEEFPVWLEAWRQISARGRFTPVDHPSEAQREKRIAEPRTQPLIQREMKAASA
jgi:heme-degrading monooxygenase HmoA